MPEAIVPSVCDDRVYQQLFEMLANPRSQSWPVGFIGSKHVYDELFNIAQRDELSEHQRSEALYWLFRLYAYGDQVRLFALFVSLAEHRNCRIRSEAVWLLTGWWAIQGMAGFPRVKGAGGQDTTRALEFSLKLGLEPDAALRAKAFLEGGDILGVTVRRKSATSGH